MKLEFCLQIFETFEIPNFIKIRPVGILQGVSRLEDINAGGDFLGICDQKSSYKHVSDFGRLRNYDRFKLRGEGNDYWQQTEQNNKPA